MNRVESYPSKYINFRLTMFENRVFLYIIRITKSHDTQDKHIILFKG